MTETTQIPSQPTTVKITQSLPEVAKAAAIHRDIAQLLKDCVFPGALAMRVAAAINFLDSYADAAVPMAKAEEKRAKKALKFKKNAEKQAAKKEAEGGEVSK